MALQTRRNKPIFVSEDKFKFCIFRTGIFFFFFGKAASESLLKGMFLTPQALCVVSILFLVHNYAINVKIKFIAIAMFL